MQLSKSDGPNPTPNAPDAAEHEFVRDATRRSIERALAVGSGLKEAVRGTMTGIVRGNKDTGEEALQKIATTCEALIVNANDVGADLGETAHGAIEGGIEVARDAAVPPESAAQVAASAALDSARKLGPEALERVEPWTRAEIKGIRVRPRA
jgi:hypothetical protein